MSRPLIEGMSHGQNSSKEDCIGGLYQGLSGVMQGVLTMAPIGTYARWLIGAMGRSLDRSPDYYLWPLMPSIEGLRPSKHEVNNYYTVGKQSPRYVPVIPHVYCFALLSLLGNCKQFRKGQRLSTYSSKGSTL